MKTAKYSTADYQNYVNAYYQNTLKMPKDYDFAQDVFRSKEEWVTAVKALRNEYKMKAEARGIKYHARSTKQLNEELIAKQITGSSVIQRKLVIEGIIAGEQRKGNKARYSDVYQGFYLRSKKNRFYDMYNNWKERKQKEWNNLSPVQKNKLAKDWYRSHPNSRETYTFSVYLRESFFSDFIGAQYLE